ncbi:luciferase family protein [Streptomyces sp. NPDC018693]|uniref:luciferase domain-containing protein n=1 Tax=unclassified Streptomyces TaxID=2593676 RepID=UPI0037AF9A29
MTPAERALAHLETWRDLTEVPASCGTGRALSTPDAEIVHFHSDHEVDLHLTGAAIHRFAADLRASTAIRLLPGSRWVTVHLDCDADVHLLLSLVSMALQAHQHPAVHNDPSPAACNRNRVMLLPRDAPLV